MSILEKVLRAGEGRMVRRLKAIADAVNSIEDDYVNLTDDELRALTDQYRERLADGETLDDLLPEAFATAREAAARVLGQRPYDVQVMGGAALHFGNIAEMKTGEGKTLTSVMAVYLNALSGKGVHVITVNDYLAQRDAEWMGQVHEFLGLTVGVVLPNRPAAEHKAAYECDITYGTNNEFGFDYLRDNMAWSARRAGPARPQLRHGRRGRLDPDRRGPDPADHLRPGRALGPLVRRVRRHCGPPPARQGRRGRLRGRRRQAHHRGHRARRRPRSRTGSASTTSTSR